VSEEVCRQCHAPTTDYLCPTCTAQLRSWLLELAGHASDLEETVMTCLTSRRGERVQVTGTGETPMPYVDVREPLDLLYDSLHTTVRDVCDTRGLSYPGVDTSPALAVWLARNVACIALSPDALSTYDEFRSLAVGWVDAEGKWNRSLVLCAVDTPPRRVLLGPCDGYVGTKPCGADLRATVGAKVAACSTCQTKHDVAEFQARVLARMGESLMTASELAGAVQFSSGPKADTITKWKRRGQRMPSGEVFVAHGETPEGADLFRVSDFLAMTARPAEDTRAA
jgi:hypothetical protein